MSAWVNAEIGVLVWPARPRHKIEERTVGSLMSSPTPDNGYSKLHFISRVAIVVVSA